MSPPAPRAAIALTLAAHPGPSIAVTAVTVVLGIAVQLDVGRLAILGLAMLLGQASVGLSNDWLDAGRDTAVRRTDKPIALGWISAHVVRRAALMTAAAAILLTVPLGLPATLVHILFIASAWAYNAALKGTAASVLPYIVSFGVLPLLVTVSRSEPTAAAPWAIAMGALLGIAAHFANVLPDLEDDRRTGIRGLTHRMPVRLAGSVPFVALAAASALPVASAPHLAVLWIGCGVTLGIAAAGSWLVMKRPATRLLFQLVIAAALINVVLLAVSGGRLLF